MNTTTQTFSFFLFFFKAGPLLCRCDRCPSAPPSVFLLLRPIGAQSEHKAKYVTPPPLSCKSRLKTLKT